MKPNHISRVLVAAGAVIILAGCGSATTAAPSSPLGEAPSAPSSEVPSQHNEADVTFAQGMIPHHNQAVDMSEMATDQAASPQVKELASKIELAQGPEIEQMEAMLKAWGAPESDGMGGMDRGGGAMSGMPGMMSDQQMRQLMAANGPAFDRMFLNMMIEHHTGAIQMAETELREGRSEDAKVLARKIIDAQRAEVDQMRELLKTV